MSAKQHLAGELSLPGLFQHVFEVRQGDVRNVDQGLVNETERERARNEMIRIRLHGIAIPRIQRDYAQGRVAARVDEIRGDFLKRLHRAIQDDDKVRLNFIYGKFDNIQRDGADGEYRADLIPLDGQQRLTTLYLLHWYASRKEDKADDPALAFLSHFKYRTRFSAETFCTFLAGIRSLAPDEESRQLLAAPDWHAAATFPAPTSERRAPLRDWLTNMRRFSSGWRQDPTIDGMLVMLDAINEQFHAVPDLLRRLLDDAEKRVTFRFLSVDDLGADPNDIFIKMNSRGKLLTEFEYFKTALLKLLGDCSYPQKAQVEDAIDRDWQNCFWSYVSARRESMQTADLDTYLMRYVNFLIDALGIQHGIFATKRNVSPELFVRERMFQLFVSPDRTLRQDILEEFLIAVNCWCSLAEGATVGNLKRFEGGRIFEYFERHFCKDPTPGKIRLFGKTRVQLLEGCLLNYGDDGAFGLDEFVLLRGVIALLTHGKDLKATEVRFRTARNLMTRMERGSSQLRYLLRATREILLTTDGVEDYRDWSDSKRFTAEQVNEERLKNAVVLSCGAESAFVQTLWTLEDHPYLEGRLALFCPEIAKHSVPDPALAERFQDSLMARSVTFRALFSNWSPSDNAQLRRALLMLGTNALYRIESDYKWTYWGASHGDYRWQNYFAASSRNATATSDALLAVLDELEGIELTGVGAVGDALEALIARKELAAHAAMAASGVYDLRRYALTYLEGMFWDARETDAEGCVWIRNGDYCLTAYLKHRRSNRYWDPYLRAAIRTLGPAARGLKDSWQGAQDPHDMQLAIGDGIGFWLESMPAGFRLTAPAVWKEAVQAELAAFAPRVSASPNGDDVCFDCAVAQDAELRVDREDRIEKASRILEKMVQLVRDLGLANPGVVTQPLTLEISEA